MARCPGRKVSTKQRIIMHLASHAGCGVGCDEIDFETNHDSADEAIQGRYSGELLVGGD